MNYANAIIEDLFGKFKTVLENDHDKYKNHVYRVFLNCLSLDDDKDNEDKYAIASVFHDIGIWTNHTIDYLNPSMQQASMYLTKTGRRDWEDEINLMIDSHHKISPYKGRFEKTVETFRKADWIDVTLGTMKFGVDKKTIIDNRRLLRNNGFHIFLIKQITLNFLKNPFNPLPMFKK